MLFFFHFCRTMSLIIMVAFLFTICVLLLNILIAQLSDTYQNVQQDAQRGLEVNRAWIVSRVELNSLYIGKVIRLRGHNTYFNPSLTFTKLMQQNSEKIADVTDIKVQIKELLLFCCLGSCFFMDKVKKVLHRFMCLVFFSNR